MNDICKQRIRDRLVEALKKEGLTTNLAGGLLRISPNYLSCVKNPKLWKGVSEDKWEVLQKWCNSGLGIGVYSKGNGHFAPENVASERFAEEVVKADADLAARMQGIAGDMPEVVESAVIPDESVPEPEKVVPASYENVPRKWKIVPKEEVPAPRPTKGQMVDYLLKEKELLQQKIGAIDVLLKCYIS